MLGNHETRSGIVRRNIAGSFLIKGFSIAISLILVPLTLRYVSSEVYGIWLTLSTAIFSIGFFDIGFSNGLKNKLAEAIALGEREKGRSLVSTTYALMGAIFIPLGIAAVFIAHYIDWPNLLNVSSKYSKEIEKSVYVIVACLSIQMIINVINSVLTALQRVALASSFVVLGNLVSMVAIVLLIHFAPSSLFLLSATLSISPIVITLLASLYFYRGQLRWLKPSIRYVSAVHVKDIFSLSYKFFILQIQVLVVGQTTNFLIAYISGPDDVASFNVAYRYIGVSSMIFTLILNPLWPAFTDAYTKKDFKWMKSIYRRLVKLCIASIVCVIIMVVIAPYVYHLWIGDSVYIATSMSLLVGAYFIVQLWSSLHIMLINGIGCIKLQTYFAVFVSIIHIPISLLLGNFIGALGVVVSLALFNLIYASFSTIQLRKVLSNTAKGIWIE